MIGRAARLFGALVASTVLAQPSPRPARPPAPDGRVGAPAPAAPPADDDEQRPLVTSVELHLPPGTPVPPDVRVDVRVGQPLSPREVRRSLVRLYGTGQFASAVARSVPAPGGVRVVFELTPKRFITAISVEGNRSLSRSAVLKASGLSAKSEYSEELLRRAQARVAEAYRSHGFDQVASAVEVTEAGSEVSVVLKVAEGEPTRVQQVTIAGEPGLPLSRILDVAGLTVGGVLDRAALTEGLEKLRAEYRSQRYYRAHVGEPRVELTSPRASVLLPITAGPRYTYHFHQNHQIPDGVLRAVLGYDASEALDRTLMARLARRLQAYYQARGFFEARVRPRELLSADRKSAVLSFEIEEGAQLRVTELTFEGNRHLPTPELLEQVRAAVRRREPLLQGVRVSDSVELEGTTGKPVALEVPAPEPERVYSEDAYREAADAITGLYRNRGYLAARARLAESVIDLDRRTARVRFTVVEGPRTTISAIGVDGLPPGVDVPVSAQPLQKGDPVNISLVERGRAELARRLARAGYLFARVDPDAHVSEDGSEMAITYRVDAGPQVRVGQVSLRGAERSDRAVVLANVGLKPGDVLDPEQLLETQRALVNLGGYRQVAVRLDQPELVEPQKDVRVDLTERPLTEGEVGLGYSALDGPRLILDGSYPNVLGQAVNLEVRGKVHWVGAYQAFARSFGIRNTDLRDFAQPSSWYGIGGKTTVSLRAPRLRYFVPATIGAHLDLIGEREFRPSFQFATLAGIAGLDWRATSWLTASLQYNLELDRVCTYQLRGQPFDCGTGGLADLITDQDRRFFQFGSFLLHAVAPSITVDLRDDPANPTRGLVFSGSGEITSSLLSRYRLFGVKAQGNVTGYLPLAPRVVLAASLRGGRFLPLTSGQDPLPAPKRFYMGGFTSLRGFTEDGVLPADTRQTLRFDRQSCIALVSTAGCTKAALALLGGSQFPSEGGELFTLGKLELRFPFVGAMDLGLFFEAGNLWSDASRYGALDLRTVAGGGIRYETPIGPLALDLGFNLAPDLEVNEQTFNFHFNIGLF